MTRPAGGILPCSAFEDALQAVLSSKADIEKDIKAR